MANATVLGRVQPLYKGTYSATTTYDKLDNVYYEGNTWVCLIDGTVGITPSAGNYWMQVASKGDTGPQGVTGSFGTPTATAEILESGADPTVSVTASGSDTAKIFAFDFGIPAGPVGYDAVAASASSLPAQSEATASASLVTAGDTTTLTFAFGIPAADGTGATQVDDVAANSSGIVELTAVKYGSAQSLSDAQKARARTNIGAQEEGDYIESPDTKTVGYFLQYAGNDEWTTEAVDVFPTGGITGYFLAKTDSSTEWRPTYQVPSGGSSGAVLCKMSSSNYDYGWSPVISSSDIDSIVDE